jgi:mycothiol system anti-sigma-R factor
MSPCNEYGPQIVSYLDHRLHGQELADFRAHLEHCSDCRTRVQTERDLSRLLRRSRPLYSAPATLRARVAAAVAGQASTAPPRPGFYERVWRTIKGGRAAAAQRLVRPRLLAAILAVAAVLLAFVPNFMRQVRAANYVETAVATHRSYLGGNLPLQLRSNSPEQVTAWFSGRVPFPFRLPKAEVAPGSLPAYQLIGATLLKYRGNPAALVTYQKQNEKISLIVASADSAVVAGGEEIRSANLIFHYHTNAGFNVVTWTNHGLSYALVSSVSGPARQSCMVCHQSMADHHDFNAAR